jgi:hypothetical protein
MPAARYNAGMVRWFQFSLGNFLRAAFWLSLSCAAFSCLRAFLHSFPLPPHDWWWQASIIGHFLIFVMFWSPMVALGALFGRTKRAMVIGVFAAPVTCVLVAVIALSLTSPTFSGPRTATANRVGTPIVPSNAAESSSVR